PPNCTSELQPLGAGIIHNLKRTYHSMFVQKLPLLLTDDGDVKNFKLGMLQANHYLTASWDAVTSDTIANCFKKMAFGEAHQEMTPSRKSSKMPSTKSVTKGPPLPTLHHCNAWPTWGGVRAYLPYNGLIGCGAGRQQLSVGLLTQLISQASRSWEG